jgi:Rnl2 family RNA ligase
VSEKIHGAHFCLVSDGKVVRAAKRKGFIEENDDFFGFRRVLDRVSDSALRLFSVVAAAHVGVARVAIHGELFGGHYPHSDVVPIEGVWPVQTGIAYSPRVEFFAFDVAIERDGGEVRRMYLDLDEATLALADARMPAVPSLFVGSYEEACSFPNEFDSTIPALLGLPALGRPNLAEGVVVKPVRASAIMSGGQRPVLKRKIATFSEDSRYHQAVRHEPLAPRPGVLGMLREEATERTNEARLWSVASKISRITREDAALRERLVTELALDVRETLSEVYPEVSNLSERATAALDKHLTDEARALVDIVFDAK